MMLKRIVYIVPAVVCLVSCASSDRLSTHKWSESFPPLPAGYRELEAEAGPHRSRETAVQLAEFNAKLRLAELVAGMSIAQEQEFLQIYEESSGVIQTNRKELLNTIVTAVDTYLSRVELSKTLSGRDRQGNWYAKARAVFTPEWEKQEIARLEPQRAAIQVQWKNALERARKRIEQAKYDASIAAREAEQPAYDAYEEGIKLYDQKKYNEAITSFNAAVYHWNAIKVITPSEVHEYTGNAYLKLGNYPEARAAYKRALKIDPDNINARELLEGASPARERAWKRQNTAKERVQEKTERERIAAQKKAERAEAWENYVARSRRSSVDFGLGVLWEGEDAPWNGEGSAGPVMDLNIRFSPLPFITLGAGGFGFMDVGYSSGDAYGGGLVSAGMLIPLVSGKNGFQLRGFGDGLLTLGFLPYPGLIAEYLIPGFDGGIWFNWEDADGLGLGFEIKYKGFFFTGGRYLHAAGAGLVINW